MRDEAVASGARGDDPAGGVVALGRKLRAHGWWIVVGSFAALTLLVGLFALHTVNAASERREAERWHVHTLEVLLVSEQFRASTFDVLRGERGYLLADDPSFLRPYHRGRERSALLLRRLRALVSDNPAQLANVARIDERLGSFVAVADRAVMLQRQGAHDAALNIVRAGHGRAVFEQLQDRIDALEEAERQLLIGRRQALSATAAANERLGYAASALLLLLLLVAAAAALAALRAQRRAAGVTEELRRLATMDELTGLPNRRAFLSRLAEEMARARREGAPLCLATIDIDHFKRINDTYGHPAGDAALRQLALIIREKIRLGDSAARLGGEEFALLLPATGPHQAELVCDRLRRAVEARILELPGGGGLRLTLSTGVALLQPADDGEGLMRRSDAALYEAKEHGRNQVRLAA